MELRIKEIMSEKNITSAWLAANAGVSRVAISNIITGKSSPSLDTLVSIAKALGVDIASLIYPPIKQEGLIGIVRHNGKSYEINSIADIENLLEDVRSGK